VVSFRRLNYASGEVQPFPTDSKAQIRFSSYCAIYMFDIHLTIVRFCREGAFPKHLMNAERITHPEMLSWRKAQERGRDNNKI